MIGKKFGNLLVIRRDTNALTGQARWVVRCGCTPPIEFSVLGNNLRRGNTAGCACTKRERARQAMTKTRKTINEGIEYELLGKEFGKLTVITKLKPSKQGTHWVCSCACGRDNRVVVRTAALRSGSRRACKFCRARLVPEEAMRRQLVVIYKAAARRRNYEWALSDEEFHACTQEVCHYCGAPPTPRTDWKRFNGLVGDAYKCNGVDRKDNTKGYLPDNVVPACKTCNYAKRSMGYEEYKSFLVRAGKYQLSNP